MCSILGVALFMHKQGFMHRDLKPENFIFVDERSIDAGGSIKLIDFGLACRVTEGEGIAGTWPYPVCGY